MADISSTPLDLADLPSLRWWTFLLHPGLLCKNNSCLAFMGLFIISLVILILSWMLFMPSFVMASSLEKESSIFHAMGHLVLS